MHLPEGFANYRADKVVAVTCEEIKYEPYVLVFVFVLCQHSCHLSSADTRFQGL